MLASALSMNSRLHFMFLVVVFGIGIYFYFVYREIRLYDQTLLLLRGEINTVKKQLLELTGGQQQLPSPPQPTAASGPAIQLSAPVEEVEEDYEYEEEDDDEVVSVTSNEIKDILTNIVDLGHVDDSLEDPVAAILSNSTESGAASRARTTKPDIADLTQYSMEELLRFKYDDLRNFLRSKGFAMKGSKHELSAKIRELATHNDDSVPSPSGSDADM